MLAIHMSNGEMLVVKENLLSWTLKLRNMDRSMPPFIDVNVYNPFTEEITPARRK